MTNTRLFECNDRILPVSMFEPNSNKGIINNEQLSL